ncbi:TonB-dependent siderophore receptor [Pseudomonas borbori]|uniref:Metal-pseudopaline receptor CntO n=1 Tax=Pseudomonas borbori TaxID=289003 RepID=A0A1I5TYM1_9PSED|nr:TonB-dependent siderophore receptor [Pseudomonas borbori]SFP88143.1 iron complex outermembrane recepter protein [Pseudomonas borbori]
MRTTYALLASLLAPSALAADSPARLADSIISASPELADGPVQGYRATRSASATKTDTPLQEVPQSIAVVPAQVLEDLDISRLDRALDFAGGVAKQNNFGGLTFYSYSIRGFSTGELYRNGFAINRGSYPSPDAGSLERIEVLKGPAASVYGRSDPGGTVNLVTKKPKGEEFSQLKLNAGRWDRYRSSLDLNAPLDDQHDLLGRVNLAVEDNGSFRDHVDSQRRVLSPSLSWQLAPDTRLLLETEFIQQEAVFDRGIPAVNGELGAVKRSTFLGEANDGDTRTDSQLLQASLEQLLNDQWSLRLATQYLRGEMSGDASESRTLVGDQVSRILRQRDFAWHDSITQLELHGDLILGNWRHRPLVGLEYENYRNSLKYPQSATSLVYGQNIYAPVYGKDKPALVAANDFFEHTESQALSLQDQIAFSERLHGLFGVRLERFEQRAENRSTGSEHSQLKDVVMPRAGLLYQLTPQVAVFTNASQSVRPNTLGSQSQVFGPEKGIGYETGLKLDLLDGRLGANIALFHIDKENVLTADPANPGEQIAAGEARSRGVDLQLSGQLSHAIRLIAAYAYVDAEVTKDNTLAEGSPLLGVAKHSGSLLGVYEFQDGRLRGSDVGAALNYVGDRSGQAGSDFELPAYSTVDLLAHYQASDDLRLGLNLNNLFDRKYYERSYNSVWVMPGEPRNLSINLTLDL